MYVFLLQPLIIILSLVDTCENSTRIKMVDSWTSPFNGVWKRVVVVTLKWNYPTL